MLARERRRDGREKYLFETEDELITTFFREVLFSQEFTSSIILITSAIFMFLRDPIEHRILIIVSNEPRYVKEDGDSHGTQESYS